jgi:ABC-type glucose/galactose transport system permease subunit
LSSRAFRPKFSPTVLLAKLIPSRPVFLFIQSVKAREGLCEVRKSHFSHVVGLTLCHAADLTAERMVPRAAADFSFLLSLGPAV